MRDYVVEQLKEFQRQNGRVYRLAVVNWGGTLTCVKNKEGLLEPVQKKSELEEILLDTLGFRELVEEGLLEMKIIYHKPQDSSQMLDTDREPVLNILEAEYLHFDGFLGLHGTDTAAKTARFLHINLPFFNPRDAWVDGQDSFGWTKPFPIVSSQEPAAKYVNSKGRKGKFIHFDGSDAGGTIVTAMTALTHPRFAEVGALVNREFILRGTAYDKGSESHFKIFSGDEGVPPLGQRTAFGLTFTGPAFNERPIHQDHSPFVIYGSAEYEKRVLTVSEPAHLEQFTSYLDAVRNKEHETVSRLRLHIPDAVLYVSKGAGNVQRDEYDILKSLSDLQGGDVYVARVPLRGGRVPAQMHYAVPGGDIPGYNIESSTARQKAQSVLALMNSLNIKPEEKRKFFEGMMRQRFSREYLPHA